MEYWELDEDPGDWLFGYGVWPVAQSLSRLLIQATLESHEVIPSVRGQRVLEIGAWKRFIYAFDPFMFICLHLLPLMY